MDNVSVIRFLPSAAVAIVLMVAQPCPGTAQTLSGTTDERIPTFRVEVWADISTEFGVRVNTYAALRRQIESGLPDVTVTDDVGQLRRARQSLARAIRAARPGAMQGEFFTAATSAQFLIVLSRLMDAKMWAVIMDDNPGGFRRDIDGTYPDGKAFATMPGLVLAELPELPEDIQFRFAGRHLILYDVRANTIIDRMADPIRCTCNN
jgi:hypothetical protein